MKPNLSLQTHLPQTAAQKETHSRPYFSTASHFAMTLLPVTAGVAYAILVRDVEGSFLFRLGVFGLLLFGLGSAVGLLTLLEHLERSEW